MKKILGIALIGLLAACSGGNNTVVEEVELVDNEFDMEKYLAVGDEMAMQTQQILMSNVSSAIKSSGPAGAVDFCNTKAIVLTDSASEMFLSQISRVSEKNRNPNNALETDIDKKAWDEIYSMMQKDEVDNKHLILSENNEMYYYKAIPLGMPTCLMCHGVVGKDINEETFNVIKEKYPNDKATAYEMGELRGLWKIKLNTEL